MAKFYVHISPIFSCQVTIEAGSTHQQEQGSVCNCRQVIQLEKEASEARKEIIQLRRQLEEAKDEIAKSTPNEVGPETREEPEVAKSKKQLEEAKDEIAELKQRLDEVSSESIQYQKLAEKRRFCFSNIETSEKDVQFYTGLPSTEVFYQLLDYVSPENDPMLFTGSLLNNGQRMKIRMAWSLVKQHGGSMTQW